jgi:hypothetical protein
VVLNRRCHGVPSAGRGARSCRSRRRLGRRSAPVPGRSACRPPACRQQPAVRCCRRSGRSTPAALLAAHIVRRQHAGMLSPTAQLASGSARVRSPGRARSTDRNRINAVFLIVIAIRSFSAIGIAWPPLVPSSWLRSPARAAVRRTLPGLSRAGPLSAHAGYTSTRQEFTSKFFKTFLLTTLIVCRGLRWRIRGPVLDPLVTPRRFSRPGRSA